MHLSLSFCTPLKQKLDICRLSVCRWATVAKTKKKKKKKAHAGGSVRGCARRVEGVKCKSSQGILTHFGRSSHVTLHGTDKTEKDVCEAPVNDWCVVDGRQTTIIRLVMSYIPPCMYVYRNESTALTTSLVK